MDAATTCGDCVDVELHHLAVRVKFRQQVKGFRICFLITELGRNDRTIDHEVIDVAGGEVWILFAEFVLSWIRRWRDWQLPIPA